MYNNELYHHGILGQKWGVRRYQNADGTLTNAGRARYGDYSSHKGIQNRLNDVDTAITRNKRDIYDADVKKSGLIKKQKKLKEKGLDLSLQQKDQIKAADKVIKQAQANVKKGEKEVKSIINKAKKNGYTITSKEINRSVAKGSDIPRMVLATAASIPVAMLTGFLIVDAGPTMKGTKYKVKNQRKY